MTKFLIALVICLLVAYFYPVVFPKNENKKEISTLQVGNPHRTALSFEPIQATGLSKYIGASMDYMEEQFGHPNEIFDTPLGYTWAVYGTNQKNFLQVSYRHGRVNSIFSLGSKNDTVPFHLGMDLSDISDIATIYSTFFLKYDKLDYEVELTEEDMNYRPLIAFDNGSFAILHVDREKGKLLAIRYLDVESLLELMPYQLVEGNAIDLKVTQNFDWKVFDAKNRYHFKQILSILRENERMDDYRLIDSLNTLTEDVLRSFVDDPTKYLTGEELSNWEIHQENLSFYDSFYIEQKQMSQIIKTAGKTNPNLSGVLYSPAYDVPWLVMTLYNERFFQTQFHKNQERWLGVSFYKDAVFFVTADPDKQKTEETITSGEDTK